MSGGAALVLALVCAATMGLAIQRGSTCLVAAVQEWHDTRRFSRLLALVEAALWVAGGVWLARWWALPVMLPPGHALGLWTVCGAALLGLGAVVNGACAFGAVARLGSGQWAYLATPVGFYLGCTSVQRVFAAAAPPALAEGAPLGAVPGWVAGALLAAGLCRAGLGLWRMARGRGAWRRSSGSAWSPHAATAVIGVTFVALLLVAGAWAYTDVLAGLARGMAQGVGLGTALGAALLLGALAGGWWAGKLAWVPVSAGQVLRCALGGLLMGWGSLLVPGGNDGLVLLAMPLLWPYAWVAFGVMFGVIALALRVRAPR